MRSSRGQLSAMPACELPAAGAAILMEQAPPAEELVAQPRATGSDWHGRFVHSRADLRPGRATAASQVLCIGGR